MTLYPYKIKMYSQTLAKCLPLQRLFVLVKTSWRSALIDGLTNVSLLSAHLQPTGDPTWLVPLAQLPIYAWCPFYLATWRWHVHKIKHWRTSFLIRSI